uniref:Uncharacterized protein n=1 Tax=Anguilla anguilla TaxID=7936 RepID=A0A0E9S497_ANGAN
MNSLVQGYNWTCCFIRFYSHNCPSGGHCKPSRRDGVCF